MYSVDLKENIFVSNDLLSVNQIFPHEEVVTERMEKLVDYLICSKSHMIIDGHHRYYALQKLGYEKVPVTKINYDSELITTHIDGKISKAELLNAASNRFMLPPKSSFHHVLDINYMLQPIILLSVLTRLDYL